MKTIRWVLLLTSFIQIASADALGPYPGEVVKCGNQVESYLAYYARQRGLHPSNSAVSIEFFLDRLKRTAPETDRWVRAHTQFRDGQDRLTAVSQYKAGITLYDFSDALDVPEGCEVTQVVRPDPSGKTLLWDLDTLATLEPGQVAILQLEQIWVALFMMDPAWQIFDHPWDFNTRLSSEEMNRHRNYMSHLISEEFEGLSSLDYTRLAKSANLPEEYLYRGLSLFIQRGELAFTQDGHFYGAPTLREKHPYSFGLGTFSLEGNNLLIEGVRFDEQEEIEEIRLRNAGGRRYTFYGQSALTTRSPAYDWVKLYKDGSIALTDQSDQPQYNGVRCLFTPEGSKICADQYPAQLDLDLWGQLYSTDI